jgi:hypothetical protein
MSAYKLSDRPYRSLWPFCRMVARRAFVGRRPQELNLSAARIDGEAVACLGLRERRAT